MAEKKYKIQRKQFSHVNFFGNKEYYASKITDIIKDLFGSDIVKEAWLVFNDVEYYEVSDKSILKEHLERLYKDYEKDKVFWFDDYDVLIEFKNGKIIRVTSSEWGYFSKVH